MKRDLSKFITKSEFKTRSSTIFVYDTNGPRYMVDHFDAPPGFQIDRYVSHLFPNHKLVMETHEDGNDRIYVQSQDTEYNILYFVRVFNEK